MPEQRYDGISTIIANYNHGRYVRRAIESILRQEHLPHEIIIIDDGSSDDSLETIYALARAFPLIHVCSHAKNEGLVATQLEAVAMATGRYVHLAASDDVYLPNFYALASSMLQRYPEAGLFAGDAFLFDGITGRFLSVRPICMPRLSSGYVSLAQVRKTLARSDNWIITGASVIRMDAFVESGSLHEDLGSFADGYLARKIALSHGYCYATEPVASWTIFPGSMSRVTALNPDKASALCEAALKRIVSDATFPVWYAGRFADRWRFATARLALQMKSIHVQTVLALGAKARLDRLMLNIILSISKGSFGRNASAAWLYIRLRPFRLIDLATTFVYRKLFRHDYARGGKAANLYKQPQTDTTI